MIIYRNNTLWLFCLAQYEISNHVFKHFLLISLPWHEFVTQLLVLTPPHYLTPILLLASSLATWSCAVLDALWCCPSCDLTPWASISYHTHLEKYCFWPMNETFFMCAHWNTFKSQSMFSITWKTCRRN